MTARCHKVDAMHTVDVIEAALNQALQPLALEVIDFFQLDKASAIQIKDKVMASVCNWESVATRVGLGRAEQQLMAPAFNVKN